MISRSQPSAASLHANASPTPDDAPVKAQHDYSLHIVAAVAPACSSQARLGDRFAEHDVDDEPCGRELPRDSWSADRGRPPQFPSGEDHIRMISQMHRLLLELIPGGARKSLSATQARALLARVRPGDAAVTGLCT